MSSEDNTEGEVEVDAGIRRRSRGYYLKQASLSEARVYNTGNNGELGTTTEQGAIDPENGEGALDPPLSAGCTGESEVDVGLKRPLAHNYRNDAKHYHRVKAPSTDESTRPRDNIPQYRTVDNSRENSHDDTATYDYIEQRHQCSEQRQQHTEQRQQNPEQSQQCPKLEPQDPDRGLRKSSFPRETNV